MHLSKQKGCRMRKYVAFALIATGVLFATRWFIEPSSSFTPRLLSAFDVCDYRVFIKRCLVEPRPYCPITIPARDACYPAIAYCLVKCFPITSRGETIYVSTLFIGLFAGFVFFLLQRRQKHKLLCIGAILLTVPFACGPLRGNTTAWATAATFVFLAWFDAEEKWKRIIAAVALGFAASLKLTPAIYGLLYLRGQLLKPKQWPFMEIVLSAASFAALFVVPFYFFGGISEIGHWFQNALANSAHYSREADFGITPIACLFSFCLPYAAWGWSVNLTNAMALLFCVASLFARRFYHALLLLGVAMAFLCHFDYGLTYLLPVFALWIGETCSYGVSRKIGITIVLAEALLWFLLLQSVTCAFSENLLYDGYIVYNGALLLLGLMSLGYVIIPVIRSIKAKKLRNKEGLG